MSEEKKEILTTKDLEWLKMKAEQAKGFYRGRCVCAVKFKSSGVAMVSMFSSKAELLALEKEGVIEIVSEITEL